MNLQEIMALILVLGAIAYLVFRSWSQLHKKDCSKGCGCASDIVKTK